MYKWWTYYVKVSKYHVFYEHVLGNICRKRFIFRGEDVEHGNHAWNRAGSRSCVWVSQARSHRGWDNIYTWTTKYQNLLLNVKAFFFFATPHRGSDLADWMLRKVPSVNTSSLVEYLEPRASARAQTNSEPIPTFYQFSVTGTKISARIMSLQKVGRRLL